MTPKIHSAPPPRDTSLIRTLFRQLRVTRIPAQLAIIVIVSTQLRASERAHGLRDGVVDLGDGAHHVGDDARVADQVWGGDGDGLEEETAEVVVVEEGFGVVGAALGGG